MSWRVVAIISLLLSHGAGILLSPAPVAAATTPPVISELQVATTGSLSDEFIELYNPSASGIDLKGYQVLYHSSAADCATGWDTKATIAAGTIPGHGFYLLSAKDYLSRADQTFAPGLASAGVIRLTTATHSIVDAVAWGAASCGEGAAAPAPSAGHSLERRPGVDSESGGNAYDTQDNRADFLQRATPAPQSTASAPETPAGSYAPSAASGASMSSGSAPLELNELYPDPASPLTDAADEYIELYNPNPFPVSVAGYIVKTGATLSTKHILAAGTVPATGYLALKSAATKIALSNSGGSVALYDAGGHQLGVTVTYPKAKTGATWARADDAWSWSATPTPGAANIMADIVTASGASGTSSAASKSSGKVKAAATAKAPKATKAKTTKAAAASNKTTDPGAGTSPGGRWLLFALAGLTIAYVIYEFRYDLQNFYFKLRGYPGRRRSTGPAA